LRIAEVPAHLAEFYPQDYYSFDNIIEEPALKQFFIRRRSWQKYRTDWAKLDAPRHLKRSYRIGVEGPRKANWLRSGESCLRLKRISVWGSEQIKRGLPLIDKATGVIEPRADMFTKGELVAFEQQAETLNKTSQGDQACFYLRKA
jgi:hypothetical protein